MGVGRLMARGDKAILAILLHIAVSSTAPVRAQTLSIDTECCADLEARIAAAQSEALARSVTFQTYGQINRAAVLWNDGINSKWSLVDNTTSSTRLGFINQISL